MRGLLKELRRNPDTVAVAVLCLMLGIANSGPVTAWANDTADMKVRCTIWANPARTVLDTLTDHLARLSSHASNRSEHLPRLDF